MTLPARVAAGVVGLGAIAVLTVPNLLEDAGASVAAERYAQAMLDDDYATVCAMWTDDLRSRWLGDEGATCADFVTSSEQNEEQVRARAEQEWGEEYEAVMADYQSGHEVVYVEEHGDRADVGVRLTEKYAGDLDAMSRYFDDDDRRVSVVEFNLERRDGSWLVAGLSDSSTAA